MRQTTAKFYIFRRALAFLAALLLCVTLFAPTAMAAESDSGKVGKITWSVADGLLTLSGKGAVPDYTEQSPAPWAAYKGQIARLEIKKGITALGSMCFYEFTNLTAAALPESVKTVGSMAFAGCEKLQTVNLPGVTKIGEYAFSRCFKLSGVVLSEGLTDLGANAFYRCGSLRTIRVPASVTYMGGAVFAYCDELLQAEIAAPLASLPEWTFYGCEKLQTLLLTGSLQSVGDDALTKCYDLSQVWVDGTQEQVDALLPQLSAQDRDLSGSNVKPAPEEIPATQDKTYDVEDGTVQETVTQVTTGNGFTAQTDTSVLYPEQNGGFDTNKKQEASIEIDATVTDQSGLGNLIEQLPQTEIQQGILEQETGKDVDLFLRAQLLYGSVIYGEDLAALAGKDVVLELCTPAGSRWKIQCKLLKGREFKKSYDLEYTLESYTKVSKAHKKILGAAKSYWLSFADKIDFPATVQLYLHTDVWGQNASLYESSWLDGLQRVQTVQVGQTGIASYALGNINKGKRYVVALNVAGIPAEDVRLPQDENSEIGSEDWLENYVPVTEQYTITAVRGFGGMTMKQFTTVVIIAVVALAFVVFVIVLVLNLLSKKKALEQLRKQK